MGSIGSPRRPDASVIVCEGEKAADAVARVFPSSVAVTSSGGAQAHSKSDWTPLAARRVLIWPDADGPGAKYAAEVALILHGLGCEVSIIDAAALASMTPDGGKREPEKGWDAADAVDEWRDVNALRKAAGELRKPYDAGPSFVSWGDFTMSAKGLTQESKGARRQSRNCLDIGFPRPSKFSARGVIRMAGDGATSSLSRQGQAPACASCLRRGASG